MQKGIIKYIVIIAIILVIAVLSQQPFFRRWTQSFGQNLVSKMPKPVQEMLTRGASWVNGDALPQIGAEAQERGEMAKDKIEEKIGETANQVKKNISEIILEKTKNYFTGIENSILHPGAPQNCPAQTQDSAQPNP